MSGRRFLILIPNDPQDKKLEEILRSFGKVIVSNVPAINDREAYILWIDRLPKELKAALEELERMNKVRIIDLLVLQKA